MGDLEFQQKMLDVDKQLIMEKIPVNQRPLAAFLKFCNGYNGVLLDANGPVNELLGEICEWYDQRYIDRMLAPINQGFMPIMLSGEVYLIRIPFGYGVRQIKILDMIDDISPSILNGLKKLDLERIEKAFTLGINFYSNITDIIDGKTNHKLSDLSQDLLDRALDDLNTAIAKMRMASVYDLQSCCFNAQQASEKILKVYLTHKNHYTEIDIRNEIGHHIYKARDQIAQTESDIDILKQDFGNVNYGMDVRYKSKDITPEIAIKAFNSSVKIGWYILQKAFDAE